MSELICEEHNDIRVNRKRLRDFLDPFDIPTKRFKELYCTVPELMIEFMNELKPFYDASNRTSKIPLHLKFLSTLHFYVNGIYQRRTESISQSMASLYVREISDLIVNSLNRKYISFPHTLSEMQPIISRFSSETSFPGIIGLIDGTHIPLSTHGLKKGVGWLYTNRKNFNSINTQIICDYDMRILNINARFCGSTTDTHIWENSFVSTLLKSVHSNDPKKWLLGDLGYPLQPWLLTPIRSTPERQLTDNDKIYNRNHCHVRFTIRRCIGLLKARFKCLSGEKKLRYTPHVVGQIIYACSILHNFLIFKKYPIGNIKPFIEPIINKDLSERRGNLARLGRQQIQYVSNVLTGYEN